MAYRLPTSQSTAEGQDATSNAGHIDAASIATGLPIQTTTPTAQSVTINNIAGGSWLPGAGTLQLGPGAIPLTVPYASGGAFLGNVSNASFFYVATTAGTALIEFTGVGSNSTGQTLTGCTYISGGSGGTVYAGAKVSAAINPIVDVIMGDSIARGQGASTVGVNDWATLLCGTEQALAGLPAPGPGLVFPFQNLGIYGSFQWATNSAGNVSITAATASGTSITITASGTWTSGELVYIAGLSNGGGGTNWANANGTWTIGTGGSGSFVIVIASGTPTGTSSHGSATANPSQVPVSTGVPTVGPGGASPGTVAPSMTLNSPQSCYLPDGGASVADTRTFRRCRVYYLAQPNGSKIAIATAGVVKSMAATNTHSSATSVSSSSTTLTASGGFAGAAIGDTPVMMSGTGVFQTGTLITAIQGTTITVNLAPSTPLSGATISYQGIRSWDSSDLGYTAAGTGVTVTSSAHSVGTGAAGLVVIGVDYINGPAVTTPASGNGNAGTIVHNISAGGTQSGDWCGTYESQWVAWLQMLVNSGQSPRRVMVMVGGNDQPGFFDSSNTPATFAANLALVVQKIQSVVPLTEVVLCAEYLCGNSTLVNVGPTAWYQWVGAVRQVAVQYGCTFVDMYARFGDCSVNSFSSAQTDPYGLTVDGGVHFGVNTNSYSGRNGQQAHAELLFDKLAYSKEFQNTALSTNTSGAVAITSILGSISTNTKFQLSGASTGLVTTANQDCMLYFQCQAAATTAISMGPSTGQENSIFASASGVSKTEMTLRVPSGWFVYATFTSADVAQVIGQTC